jgi:cytochrome c553
MRGFVTCLAAFGAALFFATMLASVPRADADAAPSSFAGKLKGCLVCHGSAGVSSIRGTPNLAGEPDLFVEWQLVYFRGETRKNAAMLPFARDLTDDDIRQFGAYFVTLPGPTVAQPDTDPAATEAGAKLAENRHCAQCHTDKFTGQGEVPRLAGQHEEVIVKALHDYQHGARRGRGNVIMPEIAYSLNDDDIRNLAHFMSMLPGG